MNLATHIVYGVCVAQRHPEVDHDILAEHAGEGGGADPVAEHPPGHSHHPHHDKNLDTQLWMSR